MKIVSKELDKNKSELESTKDEVTGLEGEMEKHKKFEHLLISQLTETEITLEQEKLLAEMTREELEQVIIYTFVDKITLQIFIKLMTKFTPSQILLDSFFSL